MEPEERIVKAAACLVAEISGGLGDVREELAAINARLDSMQSIMADAKDRAQKVTVEYTQTDLDLKEDGTAFSQDLPNEPEPDAEEDEKIDFLTVRTELMKVNKAINIDAAREIMSRFNATSVSALKKTDYRAVVDACHEAVAA